MRIYIFLLIATLNIWFLNSQNLQFKTNNIETFNFDKFEITYYPLDTSIEYLVGQAIQIKLFEEKWYVLDYLTKKIFVFNKDGSYYSSVDSKGDGPGSYKNISFFTINPYTKHIEINDNYSFSIFTYNIKGKFISKQKIPFPFSSFEHINNKSIAFHKAYQIGEEEFNYNLLITDNKYNIKKRVSKINRKPSSALQFSPYFPLKKYNSKINWIKAYDDIIYEIDENGIVKKTKIDYPNTWPDPEFAFNDKINDFALIMNTFKKKYMYFFDVYEFADNYISTYYLNKKKYIGVLNKETKKSTSYDCSTLPKGFNTFKGYTNDAVLIILNPLDILNSKLPISKTLKNKINAFEEEPNPWIISIRKK